MENRSLKNFIKVLLCLGLLVVLPQITLYAQEENSPDPEIVDAILLLDSSGSMRLTDAQRLRNDGARLFISSLKRSDRLGLVDFAEKAKVIRPLIPYNSTQAAEASRVINSIKDIGQYTDLYSALETAKKMFEENKREGADPIIVLLSDGKMDPTEKFKTVEEQKEKLFQELIPALNQLGVKIYTLAFSEHADRDLLEQVAITTGGLHWFTPTSDKIHESFADLFMVVKKPQMVPLTSKGFRIDQEIEEATFYINRHDGKELVIVSPNGERITEKSNLADVSWFTGKKFDVITVNEPEPGQWQIAGIPKNEGFATLLTNLKLTSSWPTVVTSGEDRLLEVRLYESRKPVVLPEMTDVVRYAFQITPVDRVSEPVVRKFLYDDGTNGDREARDGIFSNRVIMETPGEYNLSVLASGPTFERQQQMLFKVKPRLVSLRVVPKEDALLPANSPLGATSSSSEFFQMTLSPELSGAKRLQVKLFAVDEDERRYQLPIERITNVFETEVTKLPHEGEYKLVATVTAVGRRKKEFAGQSEQLVYLRKESQGEADDSATLLIVDETKKQEAPSFPWVFLLIEIGALGGVGFSFVKKLKTSTVGKSDTLAESFAPIEPIQEALAEMEAKKDLTEINFEDPIFTDENIEMAPDAAVTARETSSDPAAAAATEAAENEEAETDMEPEADAAEEEPDEEEESAEDQGEEEEEDEPKE